MSDPQLPGVQNEENQRARVASGAGLALVGRLGALIEVVSVIFFTWAYGAVTYGLFAVLWSYVKVLTAVSDIAMTTALQRFVPRAEGEAADHAAGYALKLSLIASSLMALALTLAAPILGRFINAGDGDAEHLVQVIQLYAWVLPFWTIVEVATAAIRARRTFGPEIRVRIFYEQGLRLVAALAFAGLGFNTFGLFAAHLVSVMLAAILALRLVAKHYNFRAVMAAPMRGLQVQAMRRYGRTVMPANLVKKLFSEFPVMYLNLLLPGAAGAAAGGYYAVARKVASALQLVRLTFEYVMAPLAAERDGQGDRTALGDMYAFATRISLALALPFGVSLMAARHDLLAALTPEFQVAGSAIVILCVARIVEAATGPSSAIVEMLGHRGLPLLNGLAGLAVLLVLGFALIPEQGVTGAAWAAAFGMNTTAILGLVQTQVLFRLNPYTRLMMRPLALGILLGALLFGLGDALNTFGPPFGLVSAVFGFMVSLLILVRYGIGPEDALALGRFGRILRYGRA